MDKALFGLLITHISKLISQNSKLKLITHISISTLTKISLKLVFGSKSKLYLSLFNSNFWQNGGAHPLSLHKMVRWVSACDILSPLLTFYCFALTITKPSKKQILCLCTPQNPARD